MFTYLVGGEYAHIVLFKKVWDSINTQIHVVIMHCRTPLFVLSRLSRFAFPRTLVFQVFEVNESSFLYIRICSDIQNCHCNVISCHSSFKSKICKPGEIWLAANQPRTGWPPTITKIEDPPTNQDLKICHGWWPTNQDLKACQEKIWLAANYNQDWRPANLPRYAMVGGQPTKRRFGWPPTITKIEDPPTNQHLSRDTDTKVKQVRWDTLESTTSLLIRLNWHSISCPQ